jgi:uncharacterized membrane protein
MDDLEKKLSSLEERLSLIEQRLGITQGSTNLDSLLTEEPPTENRLADAGDITQPVDSVVAGEEELAKTERQPLVPSVKKTGNWSTANVLGWGGATAMVLAASYLISLAIESGWLTPERQLFCAVMFGLGLIGIGLRLRPVNEEYASFLPSGGVVILFLSVYGAHLYYELISIGLAGAVVIGICLLSLWLCWVFQSQLYALFAVVGSYSAPFLLGEETGGVTDLAVYYSAWSVLFSVYAVVAGSRNIYLLALYMSLLGFNILADVGGFMTSHWQAVLGFQFSQFAIFMACAGYFSVRNQQAMNQQEALLHAPPLFLFYVLQYALLDEQLPALAPWIAIASLGAVVAVYQVVRNIMKKPLPGGLWLVGAYAAIVLFHAVYLESVSDDWAPWVGLVVILAGMVLMPGNAKRQSPQVHWPIAVVVGFIALSNFMRVVFGDNMDEVPGYQVLVLLYPAMAYFGYLLLKQRSDMKDFVQLILYTGHVSALSAPVHLFDNDFVISLWWMVLALGSVVLALKYEDKLLGQSSLVVFALAAIKVVLYDLSDAEQILRIVSLFFLGVSLYAGGWLYRKVNEMAPKAP